MWRIGRAPNNTSKWQMEFNLALKGLIAVSHSEMLNVTDFDTGRWI
jgi:hypothetical protein